MVGLKRTMKNYLSDDDIRLYAMHFYNLLPRKNEDTENYERSRRIAAGDIAQSEYDYLTKPVKKDIEINGNTQSITLRPPAEIKNIPIVEPGIRVLVSDVQSRPINFDVTCVSDSLIEEKETRIIQDFNRSIEVALTQKITAYQQQNQLLEMQKQAIQEQQDPQLIAQINQYIAEVQTVLNRETMMASKELEDLELYYNKSFKDLKEIDVENILKHHIESCNLKIKFARGFREMLTCGLEAEIYRISVNSEEGKIEYDIVYPENLVYPHVEDLMFLQDLPYLKEIFYMSRVDAEIFFEEIGSDARIDDFNNNDENAVFVDVKGNFISTNNVFSNSDNTNESIAIEKLLFKMNRKTKSGIIQDIYVAYFYNNDYIHGHIEEFPLRDVEDKAKALFSYAGWVKQGKYGYESLVWKTRDIQELVNILHYKKTLLIITSGVQGLIYDLSQKPESMEINELMYYLANGIGFIETLDGDGRAKSNSFNQFGRFDQSLTNSIQVLDNSIQMLKDLAAELTGINAIRQGTLRPNDQVGSVQLAYNQSSASTEFYFANHEAILEKALSYAANLGNYVYDKGKIFTYRDKDGANRIRIPEGRYDSNSTVYVNSGVKTSKNLESIKSAMQMRMAQAPGLDELTAFTEIIEVDSVNKAREILLNYATLAEEKVNAQQQQNSQMQMQLQEREIQLQKEMAQFTAQNNAQLKQLEGQVKLQIEQLKSQSKLQEAQLKSQTDLQVAQMNNEVKRYDVDMETGVEAAFLEKEYKQLAMEAKLQTISMFIDGNQKQRELSIKSKEKIKD